MVKSIRRDRIRIAGRSVVPRPSPRVVQAGLILAGTGICGFATAPEILTPPPAGAIEARADQPDPSTLLLQVEHHYRRAGVYHAHGEAWTRIIQPEDGTESSIGVDFAMRLGRPDLYRILWTQRVASAKGPVGAVWNDGNGAHLYIQSEQAFSRMPSNDVALSAAAGMSMGVSFLIPELFFAFRDGPSLLSRLDALEDHGPTTVAERDCRIIAGSRPDGVRYRLWIALDQPEIVQVETILGGKISDSPVPEMDAERTTRVLNRLGLPDTPENRKQVARLMNRARELTKRVRGTSQQTHWAIDMLQPRKPEDFAFDLPPDAHEVPSVLSPPVGDENPHPEDAP